MQDFLFRYAPAIDVREKRRLTTIGSFQTLPFGSFLPRRLCTQDFKQDLFLLLLLLGSATIALLFRRR